MTAVLRTRDEIRAIIALAFPIAIAQCGLVAMGLVDIAVVGRMGDPETERTAMAAVALGNTYVQLVSLFGMGVIMGIEPLVSQRVGAGDARGAWRALGDGLRTALLLTPLLLVATMVVEHLAPGVGAHPGTSGGGGIDPAVTASAHAYVLARLPGILPFVLFAALRSWLFAHHFTRSMIAVILATNVLNLGLDWVLVMGDAGLARLGLPACGIPALGAVGAGIATTVSQLFIVAGLAPVVMRERRRQIAEDAAANASGPMPRPPQPAPHAPSQTPGDTSSRVSSPNEPRWTGIRRVLRLGLPLGAQLVLEVGIFILVAWMMARISKTVLDGHTVAISTATMTFMVTVAIGAAASVRVGRYIGQARAAAARRSGLVAIGVSAAWMACCGVFLIVFPEWVARLFTDNAAIIAAAVPLLRIAALFQVFDGIQSAASGALRGAGDTRVPLLANLLAYWCVALPIAWFLGWREPRNPEGLWYGLTSGLILVGALLTWRFGHLTLKPVKRVG